MLYTYIPQNEPLVELIALGADSDKSAIILQWVSLETFYKTLNTFFQTTLIFAKSLKLHNGPHKKNNSTA